MFLHTPKFGQSRSLKEAELPSFPIKIDAFYWVLSEAEGTTFPKPCTMVHEKTGPIGNICTCINIEVGNLGKTFDNMSII